MCLAEPIAKPQLVFHIPPTVPLWRRIGPGLVRRGRLRWFRARHGGATFGAGCDIRPGFRLKMYPTGQLHVGPYVVIDRFMDIEAEGSIRIGARTIFGHHCTIVVRKELTIGEDCLIGEMVSIRDHDHAFERLDLVTRLQGDAVAPVSIGRNVWVGAKATIIKGVSIGDNAIIGANTVVTKDIPANAIAVGIPARVIRFRNEASAPGILGLTGELEVSR